MITFGTVSCGPHATLAARLLFYRFPDPLCDHGRIVVDLNVALRPNPCGPVMRSGNALDVEDRERHTEYCSGRR